MWRVFDTVKESFHRASRLQFQHFLQMVNRKVKVGIAGRVWIPVWTKTWPCTYTEPPLWESSTTLHHAVNWRLYWEGLTTQVYREHMSPLTLERSLQCPGSHFTKCSCWCLVLRVRSDMQTGCWTWYRSTVCSLAGGAVAVTKQEVWLQKFYYYAKHVKCDTVMIQCQTSKNITVCCHN